jgi:hypothetical protein
MIPDLAADQRFMCAPCVADSGLRSYAGTPLSLPLPGGRGSVALGSFCAALWEATSSLSAKQQRAFVRFADMIVRDIVERARGRRAAEQQSMAGPLAAIAAAADAETVNVVVLEARGKMYPDAEVALQHRPDDTIALTGAPPVPLRAVR